MTIIRLISEDGEEFLVEHEIVKKSNVIEGMLQTLDIDLTSGEPIKDQYLPIFKASGQILKIIIEWLDYYKDETFESKNKVDEAGASGPSKKKDETDEVIVPEWDNKLFILHDAVRFDLMVSANYLLIGTLLDRLCKYEGQKLRNKSPEEIRKMYDIEDDFTDEEKEQMKSEFAWAEGF